MNSRTNRPVRGFVAARFAAARFAAALFAVALFACLALAPRTAEAATTTTVVDVPTRGVTQRFLYVRPDAPIANIVYIPGGSGNLGILDDGTMTTVEATCGPVSRNRDAFAALGFGVALVDATSDFMVYNSADIREVVRWLRNRDNIPTWIVGGSASTKAVVYFAADLPMTEPLGLVAFSPDYVDPARAALVKRPALVLSHQLDVGVHPTQVYDALTAAPAKENIVLSGGNNGTCGGYHLYQGIDATFVSTVAGFINQYNGTLVSQPAVANYQGLWWNSPANSESGWGINFAHQGDTIFASWFTYDVNGRGWWLVMTAQKTGAATYSGTLYETRGPAFNAVPFDPTKVLPNPVGIGTLTFTDADNGTFNYVIGSVNQTKSITRQQFGPLPTCTWGALNDLSLARNYQDLWWAKPAPSESGWGVNVSHQGDTVFATWFTYDLTGAPMWLVMTGQKVGTSVYAGDFYQTTGPPFSGPFDPNAVHPNKVGTGKLAFFDGNFGVFAYTITLPGMTTAADQVKSIEREIFNAPGTTCN